MSLGKYTIIFFHQINQDDLSEFQIIANEISEKHPNDYIGILGIDKSNINNCKKLKTAYYSLSQKMHPDKHKFDGFYYMASTAYTKINEAYDNLKQICTQNK